MMGMIKRLYIVILINDFWRSSGEEFNRSLAALFTTGMVNGYFSNDIMTFSIPGLTFTLYISSNTFIFCALGNSLFGQAKNSSNDKSSKKNVLSWYEI